MDYRKAYTLRFVNHGVGDGAPEIAAVAATAPLLSARGRRQDLPQRHPRPGRRRSRGRAGRLRQPARALGLRQEHAAAHHRRARAAERGHAYRGGAAIAGGIGFVFQEPTLMPWATVWDNVYLPLRLAGRRAAARRATRIDDDARRGRARRASSASIRASSRAACGCGSRSPARSSPRRSSCCSTSRSPRSTRSRGSSSTRICCGCGRRSDCTVMFVTHSVFEFGVPVEPHRRDDAAARPRRRRCRRSTWPTRATEELRTDGGTIPNAAARCRAASREASR